MLTRCVRRVLVRFSTARSRRCHRGLCSTAPAEGSEPVRTLLQLCVDRHYIFPGQTNAELCRGGFGCVYGPLGVELRRNLLEQWWYSVTGSRARVFGINTLSSSPERAGVGPRIIESKHLQRLWDEGDQSREQLLQELQRCWSVRTNLLQGALEQFVPSLQLWLDHWARQRLKWWRKFALMPSEFSSSEVPQEELEGAESRVVKISYNFPWGLESLETLSCRGDTELLHTHKGVHSKLQFRDGRKSVPHVVSVSGNVDRGLMAFLSNSLQQLKREDGRKKLQQRRVLKLHPTLAPIKVALDISRGATMELRQVCEGLLQEFLEAKISTWPGFLETIPSSVEQLSAKYDEMGVLFMVVIGENTLESGLLQVRSRDTTIRETVHISEIRNFLSRYVSAASSF
uniref:Leucine rich repeat containing 8 family, member E n=1 Tax=Nothobranchius rachovii TaxID=451742 RepID=A0A1A8SHL2_9TELE